MTLPKNVRAQFLRNFKENFSDELIPRLLYSKDIVDYKFPFIGTVPEGVITVNSEEDIIKAIRIASNTKTILIPRGNATAPFGGTIAHNNKGIILDLRGMKKEIDIDMFENAVICSANMRIAEVEKILNENGVALRFYPLIFYSATFGGWIATGGWGLGTLAYGPPEENILNLEVITPDGNKKIIEDKEEIKLFLGSNGILGIITKVKFSLRFHSKLEYYIASYDSANELLKAVKRFFDLKPFSIQMFNPKQVQIFNKTFSYNLPERYLLILLKEVHYEEEKEPFFERFLNKVKETRGQIINKHYYSNIEKTQWKTMETAKITNRFSFSLVNIPILEAAKYINYLQKSIKEIRIIGTIVSKTQILLLIVFPFKDHLTKSQQRKSSSKQFRMIQRSLKYKGSPYSTGLWFAGTYKKIYNEKQQIKLQKYVKKFENRKNINLGKVFSTSIKKLPIRLRTLLMIITSII